MNSSFTQLVTFYQARNLAARLAQEGALRPYRYALLGAVTCGRHPKRQEPFLPMSKFFPEMGTSGFTQDPEAIAADMFTKFRDSISFKFAKHAEALGTSLAAIEKTRFFAKMDVNKGYDPAKNKFPHGLEMMARLRSITLSLGLDSFPWSLESPASYNLSDGTYGFPSHLERFLAREILSPKDDFDLLRIYSLSKIFYGSGMLALSGEYQGELGLSEKEIEVRIFVCEKLAEKSSAAISNEKAVSPSGH